MFVNLSRLLILGAVLASSFGPACAADTAPDKPDALSAARTQIAAKKWDGAIAELKRVKTPAVPTGTT